MSQWFRAPRPTTREPLPPISPGELAVTFGGHATVLVRYDGLAIAFDPMLGGWIGGVRRAVEPGLVPADLADVGLILISHRHADHLAYWSQALAGGEPLALPTDRPRPPVATAAGAVHEFVVPAGAASAVSSLGYARVIELAPGADLEIRGVQVAAATAAHGASDLAHGLSYVVRGDGPSVYLCGDSGYFSGFADLGSRFAPDIAVLPIGGFLPTSFRARHMSPLDALYAFEDLRARMMIPIHHGAFALSYERLDEPARWLIELARQRGVRDHVLVMAPGQTERFVQPRAGDREPDPACLGL